MTEFEKALGLLRDRNWGEIRGLWLNYIPEINPKGSPLAGGVSSLFGLDEVGRRLSSQSGEETIEVAGLREAVLHEGIFLLHKAAHIIGAAEANALDGMATWALSGAYQAAIFAARSILCFLGVSTFDYGSKVFLLDCWSPALRAKKTQHREVLRVIVARKLGLARLDQRDLWKLLQRVLRVSRVESWPDEVTTRLRHLDVRSFARQRNRLHYRSESWVYQDLHTLSCVLEFGYLRPEEGFLDDERDDFSMYLGLLLVNLSVILFGELTERTNRLSAEWELLSETLEPWRHPLLVEFQAALETKRSTGIGQSS